MEIRRSMPDRKSPAPSASAMSAARSVSRVPAGLEGDPAQAGSLGQHVQVAGPIVGRSARRSWPGLTEFHENAARSRAGLGRRRGPAWRRCPRSASTASTMPCCTTQPWPTSTEPSARVTAARPIDVRARGSVGPDGVPSRLSGRPPRSPPRGRPAPGSPPRPAPAPRPRAARHRRRRRRARSGQDSRALGVRAEIEQGADGGQVLRGRGRCSRGGAASARISPAAPIRTSSCGYGLMTAASA